MKYKNIKFTFGLILILLVSRGVYSQSVLSSKGIGSYYYTGNVRSMGMGGIGMCLTSPTRISRLNPAGIYQIKTTRISLKFMSDINNFKDNNTSSSASYSNFDGFSLAIPMGSGINIMLGLSPFTRMDFNLSSSHKINNMAYTKSVKGEGGLNKFSFSASWAVHRMAALGIRGSYNFGNMTETWQVDYENPALRESKDVYHIKSRGLNLTFGLMLHPLKQLEISTTYTPAYELKNTADFYTGFGAVKSSDKGTLKLPASFGLGASIRLGSAVLVGVDYKIRNWKEMKLHDKFLTNAAKTRKIGLGAEFYNSYDLMAPYWKRIAYRIGISFGPYLFNDLQGNAIDERLLTIGFGIPAFLGMSHLDLSFGMGKRGNLHTNNISETVFRIGASITGGEKWFVRRY